ncbi:MAG: short-chain dehydrogenase [Moraxellaceae bacterium]|nr:MAG: short-chain dehydrogenase [Moraxellaceae bacterium]
MSKSVVITGSNRGIGFSFATLYKARGWTVYALCRQSSSQLNALGVEVIEGIDISDDQVSDVLRSALLGVTIDLLINNAGILRNEVLGELDFSSMREQFEANTLGPLRVTEALLSQISDGGKIALISSRMGSVSDNSSGGRYGYRMSKAALNIAGVSLARDVAARNIAVAILHPGLVGTEMIGGHGDITPDQAADRLATRIDQLTIDTSGTFWHSNGETLPW